MGATELESSLLATPNAMEISLMIGPIASTGRRSHDGVSHTIVVGEMHVPINRLTRSPYDAFIFNGDQFQNSTRVGGPTVPIVQDLYDETNGLVSWGSWHVGMCHFAFADGSVRSLSSGIDTETLGYFCNRRDGKTTVQRDF